MKKSILLIRHGKTKGNLEGRYIGLKTDESLCDEGRKLLYGLGDKYERLLKPMYSIYSGPMKRAYETAEIIFPERNINLISNFTEIDFGIFENKNYKELDGNEEYQKWIDSGGMIDYPGGEKRESFIERSMKGFKSVLYDMTNSGTENAAIVCHGGNIMAIMSTLTGSNYFDFQVGNGEGYLLKLELDDKDDYEDICLLSYSRV